MFMPELVIDYGKSQPEKVYTIFEDREWTYGEFREKAERIAAYFQREGYRPGDVVALYAGNSDAFIAAYFGIQLGGFVCAPVNTKLTASEIGYIFDHSEAKGLITDAELRETSDRTGHRFGEVLEIGGADEFGHILADESLVFQPVPLNAEDTAVIMYTSGTTGKPKGVMLSHANILATAEIWAEAMDITDQDRMQISTPLFHCAASHVFMNPVTYKGGSLVVERSFSPEKTLATLEKKDATMFFGVPAMFAILLNRPDIRDLDVPKLRLFCYGAAPMPYELVKKLKETFPDVKVQNLYGQTENTPAATTLKDHYALEKIGSVGEALPRTEVKVVDENGYPVPPGQVGEIVVRGPQVMKGYLKNDEETARAIRGGWMFSGDLGRTDNDGLLYIVDRKKDMIIRGGENVYPLEVEEVLFQIPEVLEAAVVGMPHPVYGEVPKAFIVLKEGKEASDEAILAYCTRHLAKFKLPEEVEFLDELPRNASGKVLKHALRPVKQA
ncbi:class I adenylate-forming enzyme family protein [Edaphobacillus lindanitolerans]|uniref:Long-chain acyl-CoA synthetase n=1 Tax=Edaphobacillus lindanitolerans TaxID=550447 RepID=A0A1U7PMZ3_9BACI|nr:long-chain fatty acid--CoA ligase [Edaphobacillus lindanitolerans]SIT71253.1 long-chain acyl-CoA synthetase [Edaphobacillus lindanitolerans]